LQQLNAQQPSQTRPQPPLPPLAAIFWRELKRSVEVEQGASARVDQTREHGQPVAGKYGETRIVRRGEVAVSPVLPELRVDVGGLFE
jgi:hypothetical protein